MDIKFPFENAGKGFFGTVYRPVAKVSFKSPKSKYWTETWMVVDSGADFTILPRYISDDLKISLKHDCVKDTTFGVGGKEIIYLCSFRIEAKIGTIKRLVPIAFLNSNEVPALLGRLGFLETFDTEFLKTHSVVFKD